MGSVCRITVVGHLGGNAESRYTPAGKPVTNFSVAADTGYGDNKETVWVKCSLWGERGEKLAQYLQKGTLVYVEGNMSLRKWTTQDGQARTDVQCSVAEIALLGGAKQQEGSGSGSGGPDDDQVPF